MARCVPYGSGVFDGATAQILAQTGAFASIVRNGAGDYTIGMATGHELGASDIVRFSPNATPAARAVASAIERVSATSIRVRTTRDAGAGGVATDTPFSLTLRRVQVG